MLQSCYDNEKFTISTLPNSLAGLLLHSLESSTRMTRYHLGGASQQEQDIAKNQKICLPQSKHSINPSHLCCACTLIIIHTRAAHTRTQDILTRVINPDSTIHSDLAYYGRNDLSL